MTTDSEESNFFVGDSDLRFLGLAAALAARWHMKRKGGTVFAVSDADAMARLAEGIAEGAAMPLDDVPDVMITVTTDNATFKRMRAIAPADTWDIPDDDDDLSGDWGSIPPIREP